MLFTVFSSYIISHADTTNEYIFSEAEDKIYWTLIDNGFSRAGASGVLGNIAVENPYFEPDRYANNNKTYGLFQWSDVGDRMSTLKKWCENRLLDPASIEGQLAFALYEIEGGDPQAKQLKNYLMHADRPENAAMEFAAGFERCVGSTSNPDADGIYTGIVYPNCYGRVYQGLSYRIKNAKRYYNGFYSDSPNKDHVLNIEITPTAGIIAEKEEAMEKELNIFLPKVETSNTSLLWLYRFLSVLIGYLFGCILGINVIIRNVRQKEALHFADRLPSLMAVLKHVGIKECFLATAIDIIKMYAALLAVYFITKGALGSEQILLVGFGVIIGNAFPFWRKFSGGMGLVVTTVFICTYMPIWGYLCCFLGLIVAILLKSLPFGAICISIFAVPYAFFLKGVEGGIFITLAMIIVLFKHYRFLKKFVKHELIVLHYHRKKNPAKPNYSV